MRAKTGEPGRVGALGAILTRDYFPRLAPVIGWLWTPLGSLGMAAVAAMLCGLILHPRGFVVLVGLLVVIVLGVVWPRLAVLGLSGTLGFERQRVREGNVVAVRIRLHNRMPWGVWGLVIEDGCHGPTDRDEPDTPATGLAHAPGSRRTEATWEFTPACRGIYPMSTPRITTGFPFGIGEAGRPLVVVSNLLVWPKTFSVTPIPETAGRKNVEGLAPHDRPGPAGDFLGVRPYRRGDSLRRIHWSQSARYDQLIVCELERLAIPGVQVVLDTHESVHAGSGPGGSREWAIRVAASFLERWIEQGADVELVQGGRVVAPRTGLVGSRRARVLDALAAIEPEETWTLADLLDLPACRRAKTGLRVIVTTDLGLRRSIGNAPRGRHDRLVVLKAAAFAEAGDGDVEESDPETQAPPCWVWIDDPERVPQCVQLAWREASIGC